MVEHSSRRMLAICRANGLPGPPRFPLANRPCAARPLSPFIDGAPPAPAAPLSPFIDGGRSKVGTLGLTPLACSAIMGVLSSGCMRALGRQSDGLRDVAHGQVDSRRSAGGRTRSV